MTLSTTLTDRITQWGNAQKDIRAVFLLGSRARDDQPADEWSDWDVLVLCVDPEPYLTTDHWIQAIAPHWLTFLEATAVGGLTERRVLFDGGANADFTFISLTLATHLRDSGFPEALKAVVRRGMKVLVDKEQLAPPFLAIENDPTPGWDAPSETEFNELVQDFLYHAVWVTKKLRRGEMWTAKWGLDTHMKRQLLTMIQWHTRATQSWRRQIWHDGRYLEEWADERTVEGLQTAFATYHPSAIAPALKQTLYMAHWLLQETAHQWQYPFPPHAYKAVIGWVNDTLLMEDV